jgi:hypothetical protein
MERIGSHLTTAIGRGMAEGDPSESIALARLACDLDGPEATTCRAILHLLDLAARHAGPPRPGRRIPVSTQFTIAAVGVARTPGIALPPADDA